MSDTGGGDIPPIEAELLLNLDRFFAAENQIRDETSALGKTMGKLLSQGVKAGLGSITRDTRVQLGDLNTLSTKIFKQISDKLAGVGKGNTSFGLAEGLEAEQLRIHEAIGKISVEFSELTQRLLQDRLDFAKAYTEKVTFLGEGNQQLRQQETAARQANILLRSQLSEQSDLRKASLREQDRTDQLGLDAAKTANRQMLTSDKATADAIVITQRKVAAAFVEQQRQQTSAVVEGERRQTLEARTASSAAIEAQRQVTANVKVQGALQVEEAKKVRDQLTATAKTQLSAQEHVQSLIRIDEQASQQARLARTQQFYKVLGDATRAGGNLVVDAGKSITSRLFHVEHDENDLRVNDYRTTAEQIDRVTADGYDRQLSSTRSFFTRQSKLERDALVSQKRLSGASVSGDTLSNNLQNRTSKGLLGLATGQSGLNLLLGGIGVGGAGAAFHVAATESSKFESSLKRVQVASGATAAQVDQVRKASLKFGADIRLPGLSAADAADTFRLLAVSGISVKTSLGGAADAALLLSRATASSAQDSAKTIAASINAFKLNGNQAGQVADIVARSIDKSGVSLQQFNEAFTQAGVILAGTFRTVQPATLTINQMSAALALFARNGLRGSQAGSNLKIMFQRLTNPTKPAAADIAEITKAAGVQGTILFDAAGKTRTFAESLEILRKGLNKLPTEQAKAEALTEIFGQRSSIGARILTSASDADFQKVITGLKSSGFAAAYAKAQFTGYNAAILNLKAIVKDAVVALFPKLQAVAGQVVIVVDKLIYHLTQGTGAWRIAREGLIGIGVGLASIVAAKGAVEVLGLVKDVSKALVFNPEGGLSGLKVLSLGLVGLAGVLAIVLSNSKSARDGIKSLLSDAQSFAKGLGKLGGQAFDGLISGAERLYKTEFPHLKAAYKTVTDDLAKGFHGTTSDAGLTGVLEHIGGEASSVAALFSRIGGNAKVAFSGSKTLAQRFSDLFAGIGPLVNKALGGLPAKVGHVLTQIRLGFDGTSVVPGFLTGLGATLRTVADGAETAYRWLKAAAEVVVGLVKQGYAGLTGGGGLVGVLRGIGNAARDAVELVQRLGSNIGAAVSGGGSLGTRLAKVFTGLAPIVNDLFGGIPEKIGAVLRSKLIDPAEAEFKRFFGGDSSIVGGILGLLRDVGLKIGRTVTGIITDPNLLKIVGATLLGVGAAALATVEGLVQGVIEKLLDKLPGVLLTALELVFLGIPILFGKALVAGVVFLKNAIVGIFDPSNGPVISAWDKLVKPIAATLTVGLLTAFALKTLAGPLKAVTSFFSDNFGSAARAGLKAAITGDQAGLDSVVAAAAAKAQAAASRNTSSAQAFPGITGDVISGVNQLRTGISNVTASAGVLKTKLVGVTDTVRLIGMEAVDSARTASPAFDTFATKVGGVWDQIKSKSADTWASVRSGAETAYTAIGVAAIDAYNKIGGLKGIVEGTATAVTGFIAGLSLASGDLTTKLIGASTALGVIGAELATGNPILAGITAAATLVGLLVGNEQKANAELQAMRQSAADFTKELITARDTGDFGPVLQDERQKVLDLMTTYRSGFDDISKKASGLQASLNKAFTQAGTGNLTGALAGLDAQLSKLGRESEDNLLPGLGANAGDKLRETVLKAISGPFQFNEGNIFTDDSITTSSRKTAQQIVAALNKDIVAGVQSHQIDARFLFDTFSIQKVGDEFKIVREGIANTNGDIQDFLNNAGSDILSLYQGSKDVNGALGDQERLLEGITSVQQQLGPLTLDQSSALDLINNKLSTQQSRLTDIQTQFDNLNGKSVRDQSSAFSDVAKAGADAAKALLANGGKVPDPFDISDAAQQVDTTLPALVDKYNSIVAGIVSTKDTATGKDITPQAAAALAGQVKDKIIGAAKQAGADRSTIAALDTALSVPTASAITSILTNTDEQQIRTAAQAQVQVILDQVQKNKGNIPVNLLAAIGTDTPEGLALQQLISTGQINPPKGGFKPTPAGNKFQPVQQHGNGISRFAQGDVVNRPTLGVFGEDGPEVVVPLSKPKRMVQLLTKALAMGGHMPAFANGAIIGDTSISPNSTVSKSLLTYLSTIGHFPRTDVHERRADDVFYTSKNAEMTSIVNALKGSGTELLSAGGGIISFNSPYGAIALDTGAGSKSSRATKATAPSSISGAALSNASLPDRLQLLAGFLHTNHWGYTPTAGAFPGLTPTPQPNGVIEWASAGGQPFGYSPTTDSPLLSLLDPAWQQKTTSANGLLTLLGQLGALGYVGPGGAAPAALAKGGIFAPGKSPLASVASVPRPSGYYAEGLPQRLEFVYYPAALPHRTPGFLAAAPGRRAPGTYLESMAGPPFAEVRAFQSAATDLQPALRISSSEVNKPTQVVMNDLVKHPSLIGSGQASPAPAGAFGPTTLTPPLSRFTPRQQLNAASSPQALLHGLPLDGLWLDYDNASFYSSPRPKGSEGLDAFVQRVQAADGLVASAEGWQEKLAAQSHGRRFLGDNSAGLKATGKRKVLSDALGAAAAKFGVSVNAARSLLQFNGYGPRLGIVNPNGSPAGAAKPADAKLTFAANGGIFGNVPSVNKASAAVVSDAAGDGLKDRLIKLVGRLASDRWTYKPMARSSAPFDTNAPSVYKLHTPGYALIKGSNVLGYMPAVDAPDLRLNDPRWNTGAGKNDLGALLRTLGGYGYTPPARGKKVGIQAFANGGVANRPSIFGESGLELALPLTKPERAQQLLDKTGLQSKGDKDLTAAVAALVAALQGQPAKEGDLTQLISVTESSGPSATAREIVKQTKRKGK